MSVFQCNSTVIAKKVFCQTMLNIRSRVYMKNAGPIYNTINFHIKARNVLMLSYLIASEVWRLIPKLLHKYIIYSHSNKLSNHTSFQLFDDNPSILGSLFYSFTSRIALYDATLYKNKDQNLSILIWNDSIGSLPHKVSSIVQYLLFSDD